jgi:hypothetical protein
MYRSVVIFPPCYNGIFTLQILFITLVIETSKTSPRDLKYLRVLVHFHFFFYGKLYTKMFCTIPTLPCQPCFMWCHFHCFFYVTPFSFLDDNFYVIWYVLGRTGPKFISVYSFISSLSDEMIVHSIDSCFYVNKNSKLQIIQENPYSDISVQQLTAILFFPEVLTTLCFLDINDPKGNKGITFLETFIWKIFYKNSNNLTFHNLQKHLLF